MPAASLAARNMHESGLSVVGSTSAVAQPARIRLMSEDSLSHRQQRYAALDMLTQPVWIFDIDASRVHWANAAALSIWNASSLQELCARDMGRDMSPTVASRLKQYQSDFDAHGAVFNEQWTLYPAGVPVALEVRFSGHRIDAGRMAMLCEAQRVRAETPEALRSVEALLHTAAMISLYDATGRPLYRNPAARASVRRFDEPLAQRLTDSGFAALNAELAPRGAATLTLPVHTVHGERWHELSARHCRDAVTGEDAILVSELDVSALKRTEAHAKFLATHDALTGLPNRNHVVQRFTAAIEGVQAQGGQAALIFMDLDHFKHVNDTLGHAAGDQLLVRIAQRLLGAVRSTDLVARFGGDEFLILVTGADIQAEVHNVHRRITATVAEPITVGASELRVTPSVGVSLFPQDGTDLQTLLRHADLAMYSAKARGRNGMAFYEHSMGVALRSRISLEAEMRQALERDEFVLHYQPRVCVSSNRIVGAEALVRWQHPTRGLVPPNDFIPACEESGLIQELGLRVFEQAARQQVTWARAGFAIRLSVNLSPRQFADVALVPKLRQALLQTGADPAMIELEVTESMLLGTDERAIQLLGAIKALGVSIALDDFGTGYSNLAYLQRFPISTLKIDKTFIQSLDGEKPLAELIVAMCRLMKLSVVAEGVETAQQLQWVVERGIEQYQGYLFAKPLPVQQFDQLIAVAVRA
jgi:diguanylate cyclase (GGDEF)-like protein